MSDTGETMNQILFWLTGAGLLVTVFVAWFSFRSYVVDATTMIQLLKKGKKK